MGDPSARVFEVFLIISQSLLAWKLGASAVTTNQLLRHPHRPHLSHTTAAATASCQASFTAAPSSTPPYPIADPYGDHALGCPRSLPCRTIFTRHPHSASGRRLRYLSDGQKTWFILPCSHYSVDDPWLLSTSKEPSLSNSNSTLKYLIVFICKFGIRRDAGYRLFTELILDSILDVVNLGT